MTNVRYLQELQDGGASAFPLPIQAQLMSFGDLSSKVMKGCLDRIPAVRASGDRDGGLAFDVADAVFVA